MRAALSQEEERFYEARESSEFENIDTNKDRKLSRTEWIARFGNDDDFDDYDMDHDGFVEHEEFRTGKRRARTSHEVQNRTHDDD